MSFSIGQLRRQQGGLALSELGLDFDSKSVDERIRPGSRNQLVDRPSGIRFEGSLVVGFGKMLLHRTNGRERCGKD